MRSIDEISLTRTPLRAAAWSLLLALVPLAAVYPAAAQPVPAVNNPLVSVQRGQTLEVAVGGVNLGDVTSAGLAEAQGLDVSLVKSDKPAGDRARLKLVAAADAAPGEREIRLISPTGVSNPLRVIVEQYPLLAEAEPNDAAQQAQSAVLPAVLVGKIGAAGDVDCYRFDARKGQRLVFDLSAARTGSPLDATVALYDAGRKEIAANNDAHGADPFLAVDVPADGAYTLEVRDLQYRGGGDYAYRVQAGAIPFVEALVPMTSQRGRVVEVQAVGHNLHGGDRIQLDLAYANPGRVRVRATTPLGVSNALPFEITDVPPTVEAEPNDAAAKATALTLPAEVSGRIDRGDDEDFYRFAVKQKQMVNVEVVARRFGSPVDALLTLRKADGAVIETNDDAAGGADARITRDLDPGEYVVSVRDLVYSGGPDHAYRLTLAPTLSPPQEFSVRFQPDAVRVHRGGHAVVWCDVARLNGYKGDVTVTLEGLPRGVVASPVVLGERSSGVFTLSAAPDANLGSAPIRLRAGGVVNGVFVSREGQPELNGRPVQEAYLTVLEPAPFAVETVSVLEAPRLQQLAGEIAALTAKLSAPNPALEAAQAEWEKKVTSSAAAWTTLEFAETTSANGSAVTFAKQPDGSLLVGGPNPAMDNYTLVAHTDVKGIAAVRLEVLTDPALPSRGPGRAPNGNFVLTGLSVLAGPKGDASKLQKVTLGKSRATFSQDRYGVAGAADDDRKSGWAIAPNTGTSQTAVFFPAAPVGGDGGTTLKIQMEQAFGQEHTIGRFRISVATDPAAADAPSLPEAILAVARLPADKRNEQQKAQLRDYYRSVDPQYAGDTARLEGLRNAIAPQVEIARLEAVLSAPNPLLDAEQAQWERRLAGGAVWTPVELTGLKSAGGATLTREADGSVFVDGANPATDTYTLVGTTPVRAITGLRLEVLPDPRLPNNGPGRSGGNFALTRFAASWAPKADPSRQTPADLHSPVASVEQQNWSPGGLLDDRNDTGWAINPHYGKPAVVTFLARTQVPGGDDTVLTFTLDHQSQYPQHGVGRLRIWATSALRPEEAPKLPESVLAILRTPNRNDAQKAALAAYFRTIAPSLEPVRERLAELRARSGSTTPAVAKNAGGAVPVLISRAGGFAGDVQVSLVGFTSGREGTGPRPIDRSLKFAPLVMNGASTFGTLGFQADANAETGTRMVALRAEAKVGEHTVVTYSPAFPMTVN